RRLLQAAAFGDGEQRAVLAMAEDREHRHSRPVVDGVVPPFAARDLAAVERQELVDFTPREVDLAVRAMAAREAKQLRHSSGGSRTGGRSSKCHAIRRARPAEQSCWPPWKAIIGA